MSALCHAPDGYPDAWRQTGRAYNPIIERYRIHADAAVYYLTYSVVEWLPLFVSQASCQIATQSLAFCHEAKHLRVNAYAGGDDIVFHVVGHRALDHALSQRP